LKKDGSAWFVLSAGGEKGEKLRSLRSVKKKGERKKAKFGERGADRFFSTPSGGKGADTRRTALKGKKKREGEGRKKKPLRRGEKRRGKKPQLNERAVQSWP